MGPDGREMVRFHALFLNLPSVVEAQVIQEELDLLRVRVVGTPDFGEAERRVIEKRVHDRLGAVRVSVETVEHIERTSRGKFRAVISHLPRVRAPERSPSDENFPLRTWVRAVALLLRVNRPLEGAANREEPCSAIDHPLSLPGANLPATTPGPLYASLCTSKVNICDSLLPCYHSASRRFGVSRPVKRLAPRCPCHHVKRIESIK